MKVAPPYHFADEEVVGAGPWMLELDGGQSPLPAVLATWDYATELRLYRELQIDVDRLTEQTRVRSESLAVAAMWRSTASELRGPAASVPLTSDGAIRLRTTLPGRDLGGTLELETVILLAATTGAQPRVASRAGSLLWADLKRCQLQGMAPMFPVEIADFPALGLDRRAPWHLEIRADLESSAMGALHLLVNTAARSVVDAVSHADQADPVQSKILSALYADVGRTLTEFALDHADAVDTDYEPETLGATLRAVLAAAFPGRDVHALRRERDADVTRWISDSNAAFALFSER